MAQEMSEEEKAQREFFIGLLHGEAFKCMFEPDFDEKARNKCLEATGRLCNSLFLPYAGLSTDVDIDTFIKNFNNAFPGERKLVKIGSVIYYEYFQGTGSHTARGECGCPMIRDGYQEPKPAWCRCGDYWYKTMIEAVVGHPVEVELTSSCIRNGSPTCKRKAYLKPSARSAKARRK